MIERKKLSPEARKQTRDSESLKMTSKINFTFPIVKKNNCQKSYLASLNGILGSKHSTLVSQNGFRIGQNGILVGLSSILLDQIGTLISLNGILGGQNGILVLQNGFLISQNGILVGSSSILVSQNSAQPGHSFPRGAKSGDS